jgi:hypothetical protein
MLPSRVRFVAAVFSVGALLAPSPASASSQVDLDVVHWKVIRDQSGPVNYYEADSEEGVGFVRSHYRPPSATAVLGVEVQGHDRVAAKSLRWRWRAQAFPTGGDECARGRQDSAAVVYLTWKRGFKWYTLKYVWSSVGRKDAVCDQKRNPFVEQDTTILESGGPAGVWKSEAIDLKAEFRRHFQGNNPRADVPDFVGIGIMSDGDQTHSESSADFGSFVLEK